MTPFLVIAILVCLNGNGVELMNIVDKANTILLALSILKCLTTLLVLDLFIGKKKYI